MKRTEIMPQVFVTQLTENKFKRCRITVQFVMPGDRATATAMALLPMVMSRGYKDCPDVTQLSIKLSQLYGADLSVYSTTSGTNRIINYSITGIKDEYAINGEKLTKEYLDILMGIIFEPVIKNGGFDAKSVEIEKQKQKEMLLSEINDKRGYCLRQARRKFYGDNPAGLERYGYLEEIDDITPQQLYKNYLQMLALAKLDVLVLGADEQLVTKAVFNNIKSVNRQTNCFDGVCVMQRVQAQEFIEPVNAVQGKLCMVFTVGEELPKQELSCMRMAVALLGGTPTSRLFMNVREKQSLCYYCAAGYAQITGVLTIDSGIEHKNAQKAKSAILKEIDMLINKPISNEEIEDTRRSIKNSLMAVGDSLSGIESWYLSEIARNTAYTPQQVSAQLDLVTAQDIKNMLKKFSLSVVYILSQGEKD